MSIRHKPEDWLRLIQGGKDDAALAAILLADLTHYRSGQSGEGSDIATVLALITAIRLSGLGVVVA